MSDTLTEICIALHDAYERAAEEEGWKTNTHCRTAWGSLPEANRRTMLRAVGETVMPRIAKLELRIKRMGRLHRLQSDEAQKYRMAVLYLMAEGIDEHWQEKYCPVEGWSAKEGGTDITDQEIIDAVFDSMRQYWPHEYAAMQKD